VQIRSIRIGAATNSSSTHSVIFYNGAPLGDNPVDEDGYGWEQFTLVSPEAKLDYLNAQWATATLGWEERGKEGFRYVDHQSLWQWPKLNGKADRRVFELVKRELLKDGVVILGGNDNSGEHHLYATQRAVPLFEVLRNGTGVKIREDPVGKWITVLAAHTYDSPTGIKFRLGDGEIKKSYTPELMDIKVTDYCRVGCDFCYQGSTPQGRHAPWDRLQRAVVILKQLDVMEVALGGGHPGLHRRAQEGRDCGQRDHQAEASQGPLGEGISYPRCEQVRDVHHELKRGAGILGRVLPCSTRHPADVGGLQHPDEGRLDSPPGLQDHR